MALELIIGDTWVGEVAVRDDSGPVDLTGATIEVALRKGDGQALVEPAATITDGPGGILRWTVPAATTATYTEQTVHYGVRVTVGGVTSTVLRQRLEVRQGPVRGPVASP